MINNGQQFISVSMDVMVCWLTRKRQFDNSNWNVEKCHRVPWKNIVENEFTYYAHGVQCASRCEEAEKRQ